MIKAPILGKHAPHPLDYKKLTPYGYQRYIQIQEARKSYLRRTPPHKQSKKLLDIWIKELEELFKEEGIDGQID